MQYGGGHAPPLRTGPGHRPPARKQLRGSLALAFPHAIEVAERSLPAQLASGSDRRRVGVPAKSCRRRVGSPGKKLPATHAAKIAVDPRAPPPRAQSAPWCWSGQNSAHHAAGCPGRVATWLPDPSLLMGPAPPQHECPPSVQGGAAGALPLSSGCALPHERTVVHAPLLGHQDVLAAPEWMQPVAERPALE